MKVFDELMRCVERNQAELLRIMKEKQRAAEQHAEEFIKELEEEITELKRRDAELEQLSRTDDPLHFLQVRVRLFLRGNGALGMTELIFLLSCRTVDVLVHVQP